MGHIIASAIFVIPVINDVPDVEHGLVNPVLKVISLCLEVTNQGGGGRSTQDSNQV
jgi:hypothetical protein